MTEGKMTHTAVQVASMFGWIGACLIGVSASHVLPWWGPLLNYWMGVFGGICFILMYQSIKNPATGTTHD